MKVMVEAVVTGLGVDCHREVDMDCFLLADTVHPVGTLILYGWVPPTGKMDNMVCGCERQSHSSGFWRKDHNVEFLCRAFLEDIDQFFPFCATDVSVDF